MSDQTTQQVPLNAQQIDMIQKRMIAEFQKAIDDVEMRKLAVDAAVKVFGSLGASASGDIVGLSRSIYDFMMQPATEIVVKVS
jgi:seryl-tRNA synthetase